MSHAQSLPGRRPARRRWCQFSVRSLLLLVAVCCVLLAHVANRARRHAEAVARMRQLGALVCYDYMHVRHNTMQLGIEPPAPRWLRKLFGDDFFGEVVYIDLCSAEATDEITNADLTHLKDMRGSFVVLLSNSRETPEVRQFFNRLPNAELWPASEEWHRRWEAKTGAPW